MKPPRFDSRWWHLVGLVNLVYITLAAPVMVLCHGLPVLWKDYPSEYRRQFLNLVRGRSGPYAGVVW